MLEEKHREQFQIPGGSNAGQLRPHGVSVFGVGAHPACTTIDVMPLIHGVGLDEIASRLRITLHRSLCPALTTCERRWRSGRSRPFGFGNNADGE